MYIPLPFTGRGVGGFMFEQFFSSSALGVSGRSSCLGVPGGDGVSEGVGSDTCTSVSCLKHHSLAK